MSDFTARVLAAFLFLSLFIGGPVVLALAGGAALGGVGGASTSTGPWSISTQGDAGSATTSVEFTDLDCTTFIAGTHPSGWSFTASTLWGAFGGPYAAFYDGGAFLGDCGTTRSGGFLLQPGRASVTAASRTVATQADFTLYVKTTSSQPRTATNGMGRLTLTTIGTGSPVDFLQCVYTVVNAGANVYLQSARRTNNVTVTSEIETPLTTYGPRIIVMQKSGTTGRCWWGDEGGTLQGSGVLTGVGAAVGSVSQSVTVGNGDGAFAVGTPYQILDFIRLVDGNGNYLP